MRDSESYKRSGKSYRYCQTNELTCAQGAKTNIQKERQLAAKKNANIAEDPALMLQTLSMGGRRSVTLMGQGLSKSERTMLSKHTLWTSDRMGDGKTTGMESSTRVMKIPAH